MKPNQKEQPEVANESPIVEVKQEIARIRRARHARNKFGGPRLRLQIDESKLDKNYHYHWINDDNDLLGQAQRTGYAYVTKKEIDDPDIVGDKEVHGGNTDLNSFVSRVVGRNRGGDAMRAYLMKIPKEIYEEDRAYHEEHVNKAVDKSLRRGKPAGTSVESSYGVKVDYKHGE